MKMKQQLNSLLYLKRFIMAHLKKFVPTENLANLTDEDPTVKLFFLFYINSYIVFFLVAFGTAK